MKARRVEDVARFRRPDELAWSGVALEAVPLAPTPLSMQPTGYIQQSWADRPYGQAEGLQIAAVHDGSELALLVTWLGVSPMGTDFPDALAVALPVRGQPVLALMGQPDAPIHMLRWQANKPAPRSVLATGIGQSRPGPVVKCAGAAEVKGPRRRVVITRALGSGGDVAPLLPGRKTRVGFAIWLGGNDERAGIKAFSLDWTELSLDA